MKRITYFGHRWLLMTVFLLAHINQINAQGTPADFARSSAYQDVQLSPDGKYLAISLLSEGKNNLVFMDTSNFKVISKSAFPKREEVGEVEWVNNERVVLKVLHRKGWREAPVYYGELFAVNYDGTKAQMIYGYRAGVSSFSMKASRKKKSTYGWAEIIDYLPKEPDNILIKSTPMNKGGDRLSKVHKLNVYDGTLERTIARSPVPYATFITDQQSNLRAVLGVDEDNKDWLYKFDYKEREWHEIPNQNFGVGFWPLKFDASGEKLYVFDNYEADKLGLYSISLETGERKHIYTEGSVDITAAEFGEQNNITALRVDDKYPAYIILDNRSEGGKTFKKLIQSFPGYKIRVTSTTKDENLAIVRVSSDVNPGSYYLYNKKANKLQLLFNNKGGLKSDWLVASEAIQFKARDGQEIHGYISYPRQKVKSGFPLVTLVHGGPHGVRDYWSYSSVVQMLANQGFAVLRINYRGSDGYGVEFNEAGYEHWGDLIQQDIIDGTRWAMQQPNISTDKACIMGGSFGAYSAMQSAILEPELFKCVVATAGIYDLPLMFEEGDLPEKGFGESYLKMVLGEDKAKMRRFSPAFNVQALKAKLFIAHGEEDERAPYEQAEVLMSNLEKAHKPFRHLKFEKEAHGFYADQNRARYFEEVSDFLRENLK